MFKKLGKVFCPDGTVPLMNSHAAIPFAESVNQKILRVYFSSRDSEGKSRPFSAFTDSSDPTNVLRIDEEPMLPLGKLGTFDDCGIMPSSLVSVGSCKFLYYIGWNPQVSVSYRLSIGLAISEDNGTSFRKYSNGPVRDRSSHEPYFNTAPYVIFERGVWRMWYISCTEWVFINSYPEPKYHIKYCESDDGLNWIRPGVVCIDYDHAAEAIGRPCVFFEDGVYKMFYSYRKLDGYRSRRECAYRLGYAESLDGVSWTKMGAKDAVKASEEESAWDYEMIAYCHVLTLGQRSYMFYNGNGFGRTGFGVAVLDRKP